MRNFLRSVFIVALCHLAWGQGSVVTGVPVVVNGVGQPQPQATVAITSANPCGTSPGYTNCGGLPSGTYLGTLPPASLATTYVDITLGTSCTAASGPLNGSGCANPGQADGQGNVVAYVAAAGYWCTVYGVNITAQVQPCIGPAPATGSGLLSSNNTWTGTNTFSNTVTLGTVHGNAVFAGNLTFNGTLAAVKGLTVTPSGANPFLISTTTGDGGINYSITNGSNSGSGFMGFVVSTGQNGLFESTCSYAGTCYGWTWLTTYGGTQTLMYLNGNGTGVTLTNGGDVALGLTANNGINASTASISAVVSSGSTGEMRFTLADSGANYFRFFATGNNGEVVRFSAKAPVLSLVLNNDGTLTTPNGIKSGTTANTDQDGQIVIASSTTGTYAFANTYANAPYCQLTPAGDPTSVGVYWATATNLVLTAHVKSSGSITFNYHCGLTS
jgi:hypothetical protein